MGWRWCYYTLGIFTTAIFLAFVFFYEETKCDVTFGGLGQDAPNEHALAETIGPDSKSNVTDNVRAGSGDADANTDTKAIDQPNVHNHYIDPSIPMNSWKKRMALVTYTNEPIGPHFYRPLIVLFTFPAVFFAGLQYAAGVVWLTIMASVLGNVMVLPPYSFDSAQVGYMSAGPFIGNLLGSLYGGYLGDRSILFYARRNKGMYEPELRLYLLHLPVLAMSGGIMMFGISLYYGEHWIIPSIGGAMFGFGLGSIGDAALTYVIDSYKDVS